MNAYTQPTIWEVPNDVWTLIEQVLNEVYPAKPKGHRRVELRRVLNGIIFRLRTGCQWNQLPKQFGDDSTVHRHFQRWCDLGVFERIWAVLLQACDELGGVVLDAASCRCRHGQSPHGWRPGGLQSHRPREKAHSTGFSGRPMGLQW